MSNPFNDPYNNMFSFWYRDPKYKAVLSEYDKHPLVYILNASNKHTLAINIHWVPVRYRFKFISFLMDLNKKKIKNRKKLTRIVYNTMKATPELRPAIKGIRLYLNNRVKSVVLIPRDKIGKLMLVHPRYHARKIRGGGYRKRK